MLRPLCENNPKQQQKLMKAIVHYAQYEQQFVNEPSLLTQQEYDAVFDVYKITLLFPLLEGTPIEPLYPFLERLVGYYYRLPVGQDVEWSPSEKLIAESFYLLSSLLESEAVPLAEQKWVGWLQQASQYFTSDNLWCLQQFLEKLFQATPELSPAEWLRILEPMYPQFASVVEPLMLSTPFLHRIFGDLYRPGHTKWFPLYQAILQQHVQDDLSFFIEHSDFTRLILCKFYSEESETVTLNLLRALNQPEFWYSHHVNTYSVTLQHVVNTLSYVCLVKIQNPTLLNLLAEVWRLDLDRYVRDCLEQIRSGFSMSMMDIPLPPWVPILLSFENQCPSFSFANVPFRWRKVFQPLLEAEKILNAYSAYISRPGKQDALYHTKYRSAGAEIWLKEDIVDAVEFSFAQRQAENLDSDDVVESDPAAHDVSYIIYSIYHDVSYERMLKLIKNLLKKDQVDSRQKNAFWGWVQNIFRS